MVVVDVEAIVICLHGPANEALAALALKHGSPLVKGDAVAGGHGPLPKATLLIRPGCSVPIRWVSVFWAVFWILAELLPLKFAPALLTGEDRSFRSTCLSPRRRTTFASCGDGNDSAGIAILLCRLVRAEKYWTSTLHASHLAGQCPLVACRSTIRAILGDASPRWSWKCSSASAALQPRICCTYARLVLTLPFGLADSDAVVTCTSRCGGWLAPTNRTLARTHGFTCSRFRFGDQTGPPLFRYLIIAATISD